MATVRWTPAQADAIYTKGRSIAVSAAAGSGKTAVLTRRIIERVCDAEGEGDLSRILVVTFTKAAAGELVSRISDALSDELAKNPENKHIRRQSLLVSSAHISTIHSFCLDLIRTNFQKLDIPADFSAGGEAEIKLMMQNIAEELIGDCFEGELLPEEEPIARFDRFADTFGDVARGEKLSETVIALYNTLSSTLYFLDLIDVYRDRARDAVRDGFDGSVWETTIRDCLRDLLTHYEKIYGEALAYIDDHDELAGYRALFTDEYDEIASLLDALRAGRPYRVLSDALATHSVARLPSIRGIRDERMNFYKDARTSFHKELKKLTQECYAFDEETLLKTLAATAELLDDLGKFMRNFERRFREEKRRRKLITFADMERFALRLLWDREQDAPTELARSLRDSYDEIYIDEYQDTNEIQNKIFLLISKENNRFNVGDIKQSIYAFRGAEPSIFSELLRVRPKYTAEETSPAVKIYLSENFRSTSEILDFSNAVFEVLMNAETERYGTDERLNCGSGRHGALPELCLLPKKSDKDDEEDDDALGEADYVAARIASLLKTGNRADGSEIKPSDIVILLRSANTSSAAYEEALKKRGIPCKNDASLSFFESAEVLLMLSLLSTIDNPHREVPLAATLKSPLYGVTLDELIFIRKGHREGTLLEALRHFTEQTGFAKGQKFLSDLDRYMAMASEAPCDALIWQILGDTAMLSILSADRERPLYETERAKSNLITLYDYARTFERGGFKGLGGFIAFVNELIDNKTKTDVSQFASPGEVVSIMTIHKSKGLEFPICFLCETGKRFHFPELKEKTILNTKLGISVKLSAHDGLFRLDSPLRTAAILDKKKDAVDEELRVLYVALTRAKERLIVTASVPKKGLEEGKYERDDVSEYPLKRRYFSAHTLRHASNYAELMLTALACYDGFTLLVDAKCEPVEEVSHETESGTCEDGMTYYEAKRLVQERLDFEYPYAHLTGIPSKLSVSKLHPAVLDESDEGVVQEDELPVQQAMPRFLMREPTEEITAAERGTAMHTFMQFCDFNAVRREGVEAELRRLVEERFLYQSDAEKINLYKLRAFFASKLAREMLRAERIYREKRFMIRYPASLFTETGDKELLRGETLLVQGVIDCAFFNSLGELILVDYKTDYFARTTPREEIEKTLRERHARQLGYYRYACRQLFGGEPKHTYIYAFALDDTVEI
ncbi:MAG: helicase-exonuclease AddAB subunit AddA [Clostridia bacterium]|nr:helicase-exonuclease AddAB subunit AddA [Clostridia bacterium]